MSQPTAPPQTPARTRHIAIVVCDTLVPELSAAHGSYQDLYNRLLRQAAALLASNGDGHPSGPRLLRFLAADAADAAGPAGPADGGLPVRTSVWHAPDNELPGPADLDDIDAILIGGSRTNAYDQIPWVLNTIDFIKLALSHRKGPGRPLSPIRLLGVCFGLQLISIALGGTCRPAPVGWELGSAHIGLTDDGARFFGRAADDEKTSSVRIMQVHRDHVPALPPGAVLLGSSSKCLVQAYYHGEQIVAFQGHPEFSTAFMADLVKNRVGSGAVSAEQGAEALASLGGPADGVFVTARALRYITKHWGWTGSGRCEASDMAEEQGS